MLEVHPDPPNAAVDPLQAIDFDELSDIHKTLKGIAKVLGRKNMNKNFNCINQIISNKIISDKEKYALMIGLNPSKGARSPFLWNKFFNQSGINAEMYPADLESEEKLIDLLKILETDNNFIGGAVAAPYKQTVYNFFKQNCDDLSSKASFASNNIFQK